MTREILFRGKRDDNGEWVEGWAMPFTNGGYIKISNRMCIRNGMYSSDIYEVIPSTIGLYTGLTDKNGKLIFEGDIVESRASESPEDWKHWIVVWSDGGFEFTRDIFRRNKHKHEANMLCEDEIELYCLVVIGNIHDNPELLEAVTK